MNDDDYATKMIDAVRAIRIAREHLTNKIYDPSCEMCLLSRALLEPIQPD